PDEVRTAVRLAATPADCLREDPGHRAPQDKARPAVTQLLICGKREAEFGEPLVEERVARLEPERGRRAVCDLQREGNQPLRQHAVLIRALRPTGPPTVA